MSQELVAVFIFGERPSNLVLVFCNRWHWFNLITAQYSYNTVITNILLYHEELSGAVAGNCVTVVTITYNRYMEQLRGACDVDRNAVLLHALLWKLILSGKRFHIFVRRSLLKIHNQWHVLVTMFFSFCLILTISWQVRFNWGSCFFLFVLSTHTSLSLFHFSILWNQEIQLLEK